MTDWRPDGTGHRRAYAPGVDGLVSPVPTNTERPWRWTLYRAGNRAGSGAAETAEDARGRCDHFEAQRDVWRPLPGVVGP